jgi:hypothetical protein
MTNINKVIEKIQKNFNVYEGCSPEELSEEAILAHEWTHANWVDGDLISESDMYVTDEYDNYNVYQLDNNGEPVLIGTWIGDDESFISPTALDKWMMKKSASRGGAKSAKAREGKTDYSALAKKRWENFKKITN